MDVGGVTPKWAASSLMVRSPFSAARATWALNAAVCRCRLPFIASPFLGHRSSLGVVQFSGSTILGEPDSLRGVSAGELWDVEGEDGGEEAGRHRGFFL